MLVSRPISRATRLMTATSRLSQLSAHLSSSASSSSAAKKMSPPGSGSPEAPVLFEAVHALRKVTLNRPTKLNTITKQMTDLLQPQLENFEASDLAGVVLLKGAGRAFCAGGDVATLAQHLGDKSTWSDASSFFQSEYQLDSFIAKMNTPVVTFMHGASMGGGLGLASHAPFRVATETTKLAMPETAIGLFPDVGASFFLSRMDGNLGLYLGLTGAHIDGPAAFYAGFATHFVPGERLAALEARLAELEPNASLKQVNAAIDEFGADKSELEAAGAYELTGLTRKAIDLVFGFKSAEEIVAALGSLEKGEFDLSRLASGSESESELASLRKWAGATKASIEKGSPTSVKLALLAIREAKSLDIEEAFLMDLRLATACCNPDLHPDFRAGVTHLLIDKKKDRAPWSPASLEEVKLDTLRSTFFSNPPPFSNPPLPRLNFAPSNTPAYRQYPYQFGLPSEADIKDVVTGDARGSGDLAKTAEEVVAWFAQKTKGKVGVEQKVREVLERKATTGEGGHLKWERR